MASLPGWGFIQASPHEHLLHLRGGRVLQSAQGGSCFRWPGDTVAIIDTSVKRLCFTADQITLEKVGVAVKGLAVWRVVEPLIAWKMLDLGNPRAVGEILQEMLMGATRRLVANLSLHDCLTRRKDAIATELMAEVAPVVSGHGRVEDRTDRGWGIALDTIEIQDVRVLSEEVFSRLQAEYRETLALSALKAHAEVERAEAELRAEQARTEEDRRRALMAQEEARLSAERARLLDAAEHRGRIARLEEARELERRARLLERELIDADQRAAGALRVAEQEAAAERLRGQASAEITRLQRAAEAEGSEAHLRTLLATETLPRIAEAMRGSVERQVVLSTGENDVVGRGLAQILGSLSALGVRLPGVEG